MAILFEVKLAHMTILSLVPSSKPIPTTTLFPITIRPCSQRHRCMTSQVGNLLLGFYGSPESSIDFAAGQTIGALSWLVKRTPCRYTVRATSTHVEVYKVPLDLIQSSEELQQGLWQSAGRSLAFEIIRQMGAYLYWTEASLREHISQWQVIQAYHTEEEQPDWFQVDFDVHAVLIQGTAVCIRVRAHRKLIP